MSLCNILKYAAQVMRKTSALKTGKPKFKSGWYDHECYTYKKKLKEAYTAVRKAEYIQSRKSYKNMLKEKKEEYSSHKISTLFKSLNNPRKSGLSIRSDVPQIL